MKRHNPQIQTHRNPRGSQQNPGWSTRSLIEALRPILRGRKQADVFLAVPKELLQEIIRLSGAGYRALEHFDGLRLDLNRQRLAVHYPTRWDYIPRIVFGRLIRQGGFRPSRRHNGRTLLDVGYTEYAQYVHLSDGLKSPVYSIYERMAGEEEPIGPPTLVAEVGYSQDVAGLENNAARYISKSNGNIRVKATWSHWEADEEEQHEPNVLEMSFQGISLGDYRRIPESTTMARHAPMPACLARRTAAYQVWPIRRNEIPNATIDILHNHVHTGEADKSGVAIRIPMQLVREVLLRYCDATQDGWVHEPEEEGYPSSGP